MLAWQRLALPGVHEEHVVLDRSFERQVRRVRYAGAGHDVVTCAQHEARFLLWNRELRDGLEPHATPAIVVAAPRRHAMEVADVLGLRQLQELRPAECEGILDEPADLEAPRRGVDFRLVAEIENWPVAHLVLADGQLWHSVLVGGAGTRGPQTAKLDVDGSLVEIDLS